MLKRIAVFYLLVTLSYPAIAQTVEVDSLDNLLQKHIAIDTFRVNILNKAAYKSFTFDIAKTYRYASEADSLSEILNYRKGKAESIRLKGFYYEEMSNFPKALEHYHLALQIFNEIDDKTGIANSFNNLGII